MRVTFARQHGEHKPDSTVDLPEVDAQQLINDGVARPADIKAPAPKEA